MIISDGQPINVPLQALGETVPMLNEGYFYPVDGFALDNSYASFSAMYRAQPWLAAVIDKVSGSGARLGFDVWDMTAGPGKARALASDTPFGKLWRDPCPVMSRYAFFRWTFTTYELYGEAFWYKIRPRPNGPVMGLAPMHPSRVFLVRNSDGDTVYRFTTGGSSAGGSTGILEIPENDVVPFRRYNPDNEMRGMSRAEPLRSTLANEDAARRAIQSWWVRGARPSLMLSAPAALSESAATRLKAQVDARHSGASNMGGTLVLEEGMKPVVTQLTGEEMQYIQSRQLNREEVCGVYDVPPPVVQILDHATFSNITEQMRSLYRDTMTPRLADFEDVVDKYLRPDFDVSGDLRGFFALDDVLRGDFETRATAVGQLIERGVMKPAEARPLFDLGDAGPVADKLYANAALQELGKPAERVSLTETGLPATPAQQDLMDETQQDAAAADAASAAGTTGNGGKQLRIRTEKR